MVEISSYAIISKVKLSEFQNIGQISIWQVWSENEVIRELPSKPSSEEINRLFTQKTGKTSSWLDRFQGFLNGLGQ